MLPRHACDRGSFSLPAGLLWIGGVAASSHDPGGVILAGAVIKSSAPAGASLIHDFPAEQFRNQLEAGRLLFLSRAFSTVRLYYYGARPISRAKRTQARRRAVPWGALHYDYVPPLTQCNFHRIFIYFHKSFSFCFFLFHKDMR